MPTLNLDALIKESVSGEISAQNPNKSFFFANNTPATQQSTSVHNSGIHSILHSSLDFVQVDPDQQENLYDALESNPKIIQVSKQSEMFRSLSYFNANRNSNDISSNQPQNGFRKDLVNGHGIPKSPVQFNDDIPAPKFTLFQGSIEVEWKNPGLCAGGGLHNQGNTCFLNSVLQCLAYTAPLYNVLVEANHTTRCKIQSQTCMLCEIQRTTKRIFDHPQSAISPMTIVNRIREIGKCFHPGRQEDAHEFLIHLFDSMQKACLFSKPKLDNYTQSTSLLHQIFGGFCRSQVICSKCHNRSNTYDPFLTLSIDVQHCNSVKDSLARYTKKEFLGNSNMYKCEKCKQKVEATRRVTFQRLPKILVLHLKRFNYNGLNMKLSKHLNFPDKLEMSSFLSEGVCRSGAMYQLYAVLVHSGFSSHSGHYYCFVRSPSGIWYKCNDSNVTRCSLNVAMQSEAYMLFYSQKPQSIVPKAQMPNGLSNHVTNHAGVSNELPNGSLPIGPQVYPKPKLAFENKANGLVTMSNNSAFATFPKSNSPKVIDQTQSPLATKESNLKPNHVAEKRSVLSFKIPKRPDSQDVRDAKNSKMIHNAHESLLQNFNNGCSDSRSQLSNGSKAAAGYDRLHPFACEAQRNKSSTTSPDAHVKVETVLPATNGLVPYSVEEGSEDDSSSDEGEGRPDSQEGAPKPKVAKIDRPETKSKKVSGSFVEKEHRTSTHKDSESPSPISSTLSFFTSSGSNSMAASENNVCAKTNNSTDSSRPSCEGKILSSSTPGTPRISRGSCWDVKTTVVPSSPSYSNTSVCSTDRNWNVVDTHHGATTDLMSETEVSSQTGDFDHRGHSRNGYTDFNETLSISTHKVADGSLSDSNVDARSPSVSSTDSKSSLGSASKKMSQIKKLKERLKMKMKGVKVPSPKKKNKNNDSINDSKTENPKVAQPEPEVVKSPHVDHNYVQYARELDVNLNEVKYEGSFCALQKMANTGSRKSSTESNPQLECVSRNNANFHHGYQNSRADRIYDGRRESSQSLDIVDQLNQQNVTKSWNGDSEHSWNHNFSTGNQINCHHDKTRQYDEFDEEIDRGNVRKRKSNSANFGRSQSFHYNGSYANGTAEFRHNSSWSGDKRYINQFQNHYEMNQRNNQQRQNNNNYVNSFNKKNHLNRSQSFHRYSSHHGN